MKSNIEINSNNLVDNLKLFKQITNKKIMFVVKANAYGHGLKEIINITKNLSIIDYYAVDSVYEALLVKKIDGKKKILVIGWVDNKELEELILNGIEFVVPSIQYLKKVDEISKRAKSKAKVHIKLETGTSRLGMEPDKLLNLFESTEYENLEIIGLYSHFANIEDTTDHSYAQYQLGVFNKIISKLKKKNILKHFSCSASILLFPETYYDIVRLGISAYGCWPSKQTYVSFIEQNKRKIVLKPVLSWYAKVAQVKSIAKGDYIGYGLSYKAFNDSKIIVIPVGYYDGYDRKLSNISNIIINGVKAPVRGRICMNMFMAEVTHIRNISEGDKITLIGDDMGERIDADYLADLVGTINYEILSRINPLLPRTVI